MVLRSSTPVRHGGRLEEDIAGCWILLGLFGVSVYVAIVIILCNNLSLDMLPFFSSVLLSLVVEYLCT